MIRLLVLRRFGARIVHVVTHVERSVLGLEAIAMDGRRLPAFSRQLLDEGEPDDRLALLAQLFVVELAAREVLPPSDTVLALEVVDQVREQPTSPLLLAARRWINRNARHEPVEEQLQLRAAFLALLGSAAVLQRWTFDRRAAPADEVRTVPLAAHSDPAHLELVEPVLCELQVDLTDMPALADALRVLDGEGHALEAMESFGNGWSLGDANSLYFTAGPDEERDGIFGKLTVAAVPEADTYAMLLAGLGLVGAISRRKTQVQARARP